MSVSVCVCVCLSVHDHIFRTARRIFTKIFVLITYGRGSGLLGRRSDMLCTSGTMDDVIFVHKQSLLDVAGKLMHSTHIALGLTVNCAQ